MKTANLVISEYEMRKLKIASKRSHTGIVQLVRDYSIMCSRDNFDNCLNKNDKK